jgi:hypothetical protein
MKFDIDHSTPYYRSIFGNITEDAMINNIDAMKVLSTYHKKNHYLLNNGASNGNTLSVSDHDGGLYSFFAPLFKR